MILLNKKKSSKNKKKRMKNLGPWRSFGIVIALLLATLIGFDLIVPTPDHHYLGNSRTFKRSEHLQY